MNVTKAINELRQLAQRALVNSRVSHSNASVVAGALLDAERDGLASHGLSRLPFYADQAISGKVDGRAVPCVTRRSAAIVLVNAKDGFAFPAIQAGLDEAFAGIAETGLAAVAIRHSHHFGVAGHHVEKIADRGYLGIAMGNTPAAMAPWGGWKPIYGTNPLAFACPRRDSRPLIIDLSLSKVARGKIMLADNEGREIPQGWALDDAGRPTTDPKSALEGSMVPMGEAKGAALALMVEILSAALTGSNFGFEASSFFSDSGSPPRVGHLLLLLDPAAFDANGFAARVEFLLATISAQPGTRLPGERRFAERTQRDSTGIDLPERLFREICKRAGSGPTKGSPQASADDSDTQGG